jgi:hypothetical protein
MADPNITPGQIPPGDLLTYFGDLASGVLRPEDVRIESLSFSATIGPTGAILSQDPGNGTVQVISRYNLAIETIRGSVVNPTLAGAAPGLVRFNLREQGRNFDVFKQPVDFASLVECSANPMEWRGVYICIPGTQLEVSWFVNGALWATLVGATRRLTVTIGGSYIACAPTQP